MLTNRVLSAVIYFHIFSESSNFLSQAAATERGKELTRKGFLFCKVLQLQVFFLFCFCFVLHFPGLCFQGIPELPLCVKAAHRKTADNRCGGGCGTEGWRHAGLALRLAGAQPQP